MAWRDPFHSHGLLRRERSGRRTRTPHFAFCVVALFAVGSGCGRQLPPVPGLGLVTISGFVYQEGTAEVGEPRLPAALITVQQLEGAPRTATSDAHGFYTVSVMSGPMSITASKSGYVARASHVDVSDDTTLNFSLMPS
jgi:hypothetical protein